MANSIYRGAGVLPSLSPLGNLISMESGQAYTVPAGEYVVNLTTNTIIQILDPISQTWFTAFDANFDGNIQSDGVNYRILNTSGAVISTTITSAGTGYTAVPTVAVSAGGSTYQPIIGGAVSSTITVANGGGVYTYPPIVIIAPPGGQGIQATANCAITNGAVSSVTLVAAGAGYTSAPSITFVADPREPAPSGITSAQAVTTLTGAGTLTGLLVLNPGTSVGSAPTLTLSGNATATAAIGNSAATETVYIQSV